ncbi:hypothetical protein [Rhizobium lusitanum]|uniref:hypothetical protein n=1 Tax=Rhizobium lusitanum TaxID=293958 RepID=UPI001957BF7D|nr:hypothetical protein [Rhizobium lusitanum]MBM7045639.1 hypothetical protein [Rhizobium lusitanum]
MHHWRRAWYPLIGPLMIWVVFIVVTPFLGAITIVSLQVLPPLGDAVIKTAGIFCTLVLGSLGALAEIAPPFVTRREVNWRNRNSKMLFEGEVTWKDVPFLPPVLNRIRSTTGKRKRQEWTESATDSDAKSSTA